MFKMGCSMAKKILAIDGKQAPDQQGSSSSSSSSSKLGKQTDKHQEFASSGPAGGGGGSGSGGGGGKRGTGDELGDFSKLEEDPRIPLNVRQIFKITKSWKAIARTMSKTGTAMFLNLFEQNQDLLNLFQRFQHLKGRELHESTELREHAAQVMSILDQSINSLSDYDNFVAYLHSIGKSHRKVPGFKRAHFWKIEQPFLKAVKQTLDERCNETIEGIYKIAIKLIIETIADGYGQDEEDTGTESLAMRPAGGGQGGQGGNGSGNFGGSAPDGKGKEERAQRENLQGNSMTQQQKENHKSSSTSRKPPTNRASKKSTSDSGRACFRVEQFVGLNERRVLAEHNGNKDNNNNNNNKRKKKNSNEYEHLSAINDAHDQSHTRPPGSCKYELSSFSSSIDGLGEGEEKEEKAEGEGELGGKAGEKELKETLFVLRELLTLLVSRRDSTKTHQQALSTSPLPHLQQPLRRKPLIQKQAHGLPVERQLEDTEAARAPAEEAGRGSGSLINSTSELNVKACASVDSRCVPLVSYRKIECKKMSEARAVATPATSTKIEPQAETAAESATSQTGREMEGKGNATANAKGIGNEGIANVGADFERHNNNCCLASQIPALGHGETHNRKHTIGASSKVCGVRLAQDPVADDALEDENSSESDKDAGCLSGNLDKSSRRLRPRASDDSIYRANCALLVEDAKLEPVKQSDRQNSSNNLVSCRLQSQVVKFPELAASQTTTTVNVSDPLTANKLPPARAAVQQQTRNSKRPFHSQLMKGKGEPCGRSELGCLEKAQVACEAFSSAPSHGRDIHSSARNSNGGSQSNSLSDNQETHHVDRPFQAVDKPSSGEFSHRKSSDEEKRSCSSVCSSQIKQSSRFSYTSQADQFQRVSSEIGPDERENEAKSNKEEEGANNNTGHYYDDRNSKKKREKLQLSTDPGDLRELIKMLMLTKQANSRHLAAAVPASKNNHTICAPHHITTLHQTTITLASS